MPDGLARLTFAEPRDRKRLERGTLYGRGGKGKGRCGMDFSSAAEPRTSRKCGMTGFSLCGTSTGRIFVTFEVLRLS